MPENQKTLYDVLGVSRNAKVHEIGRAYNRIRADMQKEDAAPNERLAQQAQLAYETLSDPDKRDAYDRSLVRAGAKSRAPLVTGIAAAVIVVGGGGYWFATRTPKSAAPKVLAREEILQAVGPYVGDLKAALVSGEVRNVGAAVVVAENQMATTCRGFVPGAQLTMKVGDYSTQASLARIDEALDVCVLAVPSMGTAVKVRESLPAPRESLEAIVIDAQGKPQLRQASVAGFIDDPKGTVIQVQSPVPLPNGTPVFDSQARLAGIVVSPHSYGEGLVVALPASRLMQAGKAAAAAITAPPEPGHPVERSGPAEKGEKAAKNPDDVPQAAARSKELEKAYDVRTKMLDEAERRDTISPPAK